MVRFLIPSYVRLVLPLALGALTLACSGGGGGGDTGNPDYQISASGGGILRQSAQASVTVQAQRIDGFDLPIVVSVTGLPAGVTADPLTIATEATAGTLTLSAASDADTGEATFTVSGDADGTIRDVAVTMKVLGPSGALDPGFDADGLVASAFALDSESGNDVAVQADGKIVVAGTIALATQDVLVARYSADGVLDTSFGGGDGFVTYDLNTNTDLGTGVAIQADGKIVVSASAYDGAAYDFAVLRLNADGTLDSTFTSGIVRTDFGANDMAADVEIQPDGKILLSGSSAGDFAFARYTATGVLDTTFNASGRYTIDAGGTADTAQELAVQPDGNIVAGGYTGAANGYAVVRLTAAGALDTGFGTAGIASTAMGTNGQGAAMVLAPNGDILVGGSSGVAGALEVGLVRFTPAGALDATFGTAGKLSTQLNGATTSSVSAIRLAADGSIVLAGSTTIGTDTEFLLARVTTTGTPDTAFGTNGFAHAGFGNGLDFAAGVVLQEDRAVLVGTTSNGSNNDVGLMRLWF